MYHLPEFSTPASVMTFSFIISCKQKRPSKINLINVVLVNLQTNKEIPSNLPAEQWFQTSPHPQTSKTIWYLHTPPHHCHHLPVYTYKHVVVTVTNQWFTSLMWYLKSRQINRCLAALLSHRLKSLSLSRDVHSKAVKRCDHLSHGQIHWLPLKHQCPAVVFLKARWLILLRGDCNRNVVLLKPLLLWWDNNIFQTKVGVVGVHFWHQVTLAEQLIFTRDNIYTYICIWKTLSS